MPRAPAAAAYGTVILCWLLSAGVYIAAKWAAADMPPWALCFWRPALAGLLLLPVVRGHYAAMGALLRTRAPMLLLVGGIGLGMSPGSSMSACRPPPRSTPGSSWR